MDKLNAQLNQLKVADLKQYLKARKLSLVGNKSDLIERLRNALIEERRAVMLNSGPAGANQFPGIQQTVGITQNQNILQQQPSFVSGSSSIDNNFLKVPSEIDEDAILGEDDDEPPSIIMNKAIPNEDLLLADTSTTSIPTKPKMAASIPTTTTVSVSAKKTSQNLITGDQTSQQPTPTPTVPKTTTTSGSSSLKVLNKDNKSVPLTSEERKRLRQIKFADPKLVARAQKFGLELKEAQPTEENKILKRVERFGEVVSNKAKTLDERERLERRKERFGAITANNKTTNSPGIVTENIKKRQERFGVVEKPARLTTMANKRRRF